MQKNRIKLLAVAAVVLIAAAYFAVTKEKSEVSNSDAGKLLYPELKAQINDITQIELAQHDEVFHVVKSDSGWQVKEKNDYAADVSKLKQTVLAISDLTTIEPKTKKADRYSVLGVEDVKADSSSSQIRLLNREGKELAGLIVGKQESNSLSGAGVDSVYVRKISDSQSWLVKGQVRLDAKSNQWIDTKLFDVGPKRIQKVILTAPDKQSLTIEKNDRSAQDFNLLAIAKNKTIESTSEVNAIADAISNIIIRDVDVQKSEKAPSFDKDVYHAEFIGFDGLVVDVDTVKLHGKHFAKFSAKFDPSVRKEDQAEDGNAAMDKSNAQVDSGANANTEVPSIPGHGAAAKPPALATAEETAKEAQELNAKFNQWIFEISSTKADSMRKTMADLVKDKVADNNDKSKKSK